jgi:hypothetical protein
MMAGGRAVFCLYAIQNDSMSLLLRVSEFRVVPQDVGKKMGYFVVDWKLLVQRRQIMDVREAGGHLNVARKDR